MASSQSVLRSLVSPPPPSKSLDFSKLSSLHLHDAGGLRKPKLPFKFRIPCVTLSPLLKTEWNIRKKILEENLLDSSL